MGDWIYYSAFLRLRDVAQRISTAEEVHPSTELNRLLQRALTGRRAKEVATYLALQRERFFNSVVVGVYAGDPQWYELDVGPNRRADVDKLPHELEGVLGILVLSGGEKLFALDGQHRVVGIRSALKEKPELGKDEVSTIFVGHHESPEGERRTRRLFSTLNRYAKPVTKKEIIALDEDDVVAIVTRRLLNDYPLFTGRKVSATGTKALPRYDTRAFTTIVAVYDALDAYLRLGLQRWTVFKRFRRSDEEIEGFYKKSVALWDEFRRNFPAVNEVACSNVEDEVAGNHRSDASGGHFLFRPIGLVIAVRVISHLVDHGATLKKAVEQVAAVPMELSEPPWRDLLWDVTNRRIIYSGENQKVAYRLLSYGAGGDLAALGIDLNQLRVEWAGLVKMEPESLQIKRYVTTNPARRS